MRCASTTAAWRAKERDRADFNPGNCWVTRLAFEPAVAVDAIRALLQPHIDAGRLHVHLRTKATGPRSKPIASWRCRPSTSSAEEITRFHPQLVLDATELGDLLPLVRRRIPGGRRDRGRDRRAARAAARAQAALRPELHLHLRARAPARGRVARDRRAARIRRVPRRRQVQPAHRGPRRRDLRRGQRLARVQRLRHAARHQGLAVGLSPARRPRAVRRDAIRPTGR